MPASAYELNRPQPPPITHEGNRNGTFVTLTKMEEIQNILDVTTNVVVIVFAVVAIGVLVKNYFAPQDVKTSVTLKKGSVFPEIAGVGYRQTPRTLILALNVDCRYCTRSVPFYNSLAEAQQEKADQVNIVADFINKDPQAFPPGGIVKTTATVRLLVSPAQAATAATFSAEAPAAGLVAMDQTEIINQD